MNISEPAPGVHFVEGPASNWLIVRSAPAPTDDAGFILIDGGYPADRDLVLQSVRELGLDPADAKAMLITHGHVDHTGSAAYFSRTFGTAILCSPEELAHVQGKEKHQVTLGQVLARVWRPKVFRWMLHVIKAKALQAEPATHAEAWTQDRLAGLPGKPTPIAVPGHTPGNVAILLPDAGAIAVGDTFVSGHPISSRQGRRCCTGCSTTILRPPSKQPAGWRKSKHAWSSRGTDPRCTCPWPKR
ncbi:beta-lactamase [Paenarthrobacter nicotinovorans]|uniref:MBL fold metallo-hydrolase n=1 Tax=Paenarthrobacter nicotinovorans TaxID=29320 RepID=UPI0007CCCEEA|nr:MBL fold metallo-hydrolase [Paenarthrobacter nicotinovorans]GAT86361.1 beta-lactamase [Paenarthrobacter nicotinovorans]